MTTIQIADAEHPRHNELQQAVSREGFTSGAEHSIYTRRLGRSDTIESTDGIYNIRSRSAAPSVERFKRSYTEQFPDEDPGLGREGDYKHKQVSACLGRWMKLTSIRPSKVQYCYGLPINQQV